MKIATKLKSPHPNPLPKGEGTNGSNPLPKGEGTKQVRPGDELEVTVTTTDPQGKPVAAELSLAMVEQSLLERFASPLPSIGDFFRGAERQAAVRCTSSIVFNYRPATQPINPRLLAEADREEIAREEAESRSAALVAQRRIAGPGPIPGASAVTDRSALQFGGANSDSGLIGNIALDENNETDGGASSDVTAERMAGIMGLGDGTLRGFQTQGRNYNRSRFGLNGGFQDWHIGMEVTIPNGLRPAKTAYPVADLVQSAILDNGTLQFNGGGTKFSAGNLNGLVAQNQKQVVVIDNSGMYRSVRLGENGRLDEKRAAALAAEFNASGAILLSALLSQETGYWNPAVATGADGTAPITLTVPERSTAWKFLAKGLSVETLAGEASDDLTVKKDLFGEIKLPLAFTDGDMVEVPVTVHNDAVEKGKIEVVLRTTIGGRRVEETKTVDVAGKGLKEVSFKEELKRADGKDAGDAGTRRRGEEPSP